ncbi:helix-turn-helix domain-containing protein [Nonomuraea sp. NBC_00507]|uniref:helix-turn-helix domain-containing protein n=1 Tax=Nonomuraea sp. NBC_00507 TaxID=2976002 RepID=UPI002E16F948
MAEDDRALRLPPAEAGCQRRAGALAFGKALYDRRVALGLSVTEVADRAGMTEDEIECIEEGGTTPTIALLRRLAAALDADAFTRERLGCGYAAAAR